MSSGFTLLHPHSPIVRFPLHQGTVSVGRSAECALVLKNATVSRRHAEITVAGMSVVVRDLGSRNGTYLDGQRIGTTQVLSGQRLSFGDVAFVLAAMDRIDVVDPEPSTDACERDKPDSQGVPAVTLLSPAERRVFDLLLEGMAEKQIGSRLHISQHTVHCHVRAIYRAFQVHSRPELFARLMQMGHTQAGP